MKKIILGLMLIAWFAPIHAASKHAASKHVKIDPTAPRYVEPTKEDLWSPEDDTPEAVRERGYRNLFAEKRSRDLRKACIDHGLNIATVAGACATTAFIVEDPTGTPTFASAIATLLLSAFKTCRDCRRKKERRSSPWPTTNPTTPKSTTDLLPQSLGPSPSASPQAAVREL